MRVLMLGLDGAGKVKNRIWQIKNLSGKYLNPQAVGMAVARPQGFEIDSRGHFTANKIQNVTNVKLRSLALVFNSKFDHK